jgi:hypothetical protein
MNLFGDESKRGEISEGMEPPVVCTGSQGDPSLPELGTAQLIENKKYISEKILAVEM